MGWELDDVEQPFAAQLNGLGWQLVQGSLDDPAATTRTNFTQVVQESVLREQLLTLNPGPAGKSWLDEAHLAEAVAAVTRPGTHKLMEANQKTTEFVTQGAYGGQAGRLGRWAWTDHSLYRLA